MGTSSPSESEPSAAADLFETICSEDVLAAAWKKVESKSSRGGIDGVTIGDFAASAGSQLAKLRQDLLNQTYAPQPFQAVSIPKP